MISVKSESIPHTTGVKSTSTPDYSATLSRQDSIGAFADKQTNGCQLTLLLHGNNVRDSNNEMEE